jgi:acetoin:2,6-dichlorophenolindophenol oxidoreductase subunit alpha
VTTDLTHDRLPELLKQMWLIRFFEEAAIRLYGEGHYRGSTHPYIGQEATAVGAWAALESGDRVLATYRGHGACLASGSDPARMMAEILGRESGLCHGRGGSMHLADGSTGFLGSNAVVAAHIPIAGGVALSQLMDGAGRVTVCFFGDGATCEGIFYETLNMAALWKLPLIFLVENNEFAIATPVAEAVSVQDISQRAQGFGLPGVTIDGKDVFAVHETVREAVARARHGAGPTLIEAKTVRWSRHSAVSAGGSASGKDAERWRTVDPILRFTQTLTERGIITAADAERIEADARAEIDRAVAAALDSPMPDSAAIFDYVFA